MIKFLTKITLWRIGVIVIYNKLITFLSNLIPRKKMIVLLEQGSLQGLHYKTRLSNKPYVRFLGIPYAKPPIKELRFKAPVKHPGWCGVLKAFSVGNMCMQHDVFFTKNIVGSEDCLYLNLFVPQEQSNEKKAVMVFIHGGAFNYGSGSTDFYSPDYLLDENVIVVTFNYRLNVLGFLNLDIDECPGNMGLKDQLLAIKWVKENISVFGGNSDNITIFGESAGSASVHYHTLSPQSTGQFQKAIMQSGCAFNPWAFNKNHKEAACKLAEILDCQKNNPLEIVEYLRNIPAIDLVKASTLKYRFEGQRKIINFQFVPTLENDVISEPFLPASPEILVKTACPIPIISGINNLEGIIVLGELKTDKIFDFYKSEEISKLLESNYNDDIINKIRNFYFSDYKHQNEIIKLENICQMFSDVFFIKDFHRSFNHFLENDIKPVYNYEFRFNGELNFCKNILLAPKPLFMSLNGASHADELFYLFYNELFGSLPKANSPEYRMCRTMCKLWCNFAKTGNPNSSDLCFTWDNTSLDNPKYLSIDGDNTSLINGLLNSTSVQFWENISNLVQLKQKL